MGIVNQSITVRNPPSRDYVMRATMPIARGTDVRLVGNSLNAQQQKRIIARTKNWEIYEWMVYAPAGTAQVLISDDYTPSRPQVGHGGIRGVKPRMPSGPQPLEGAFVDSLNFIRDPAGMRLIIDGWNGATEEVPLTGALGAPIRSGPLKVTYLSHVRTVNFGSFHVIWDVTANDPYWRLTLNWHTGIPAPELIFQSVRVAWLSNSVAWAFELDDPVGQPGNGYLVKPESAGNGHLMPRMAQRSFRLVVWPVGTPFLNTYDDPGWGIGNWTAGGFGAMELNVPSFAHITNPDLATRVASAAVNAEAELSALENDWDSEGDPDTMSDSPSPPGILWPTWGQGYGGPTGSDQIYKPNNGIRTLAANERSGVRYHKILQLRNHCRDWTAIYEPNGQPVIPENHLDSSGNAGWLCTLASSPPNIFQPEQGHSLNPYGQWKDAGFNFDAFSERRVPPSGVRPYELQSQGNIVRWDCWDDQHRLLLYQDDIALAWLDADPLAILYLVQQAEIARMIVWAGPGSAQRMAVPSSAGIGQSWGRGIFWQVYAIASAAPFALAGSPLTDDEGGNISPEGRRLKWAEQELEVFVTGSEKAKMPNGVCWYNTSGKVFTTPPFSSNYHVHQSFEISYGCTTLMACLGVFGNHWTSLIDPSRAVSIAELVRGWAACLNQLTWITSQTVSAFAVNAGGAGYTTGQVVYLVSDEHYATTNPGGNPMSPLADASATVTASGGIVSAAAVAAAGQYFTQPYAPTKTYSLVNAPTIGAAGSGYAANQILTLIGSTDEALKTNGIPQTLQVKITTVNGSGGVTGITLHRTGRYFVPPPAGPVSTTPSAGTGTGCTLNYTRSAAGNGLTLTPTWTVPVELASLHGTWKVFAVGPYPGSTRYTVRADVSPADLFNRTVFATPYTYDALTGAQTAEKLSLYNALAYFALVGAVEAAGLLLQLTGEATLTAAIAQFKNRVSVNGCQIENFWPLLAFYDQ